MSLFKNYILNKYTNIVSLVDRGSVTKLQYINAAYNRFLEILSGLYDIRFNEQKVKIRNKIMWIPKYHQRSSKRKQTLCEKCLKKNKQNQWRKIQDIKHYSKHWRRVLKNLSTQILLTNIKILLNCLEMLWRR